MHRVTKAMARVRRRIARAYHLICARDDVHALGLTVPAGVWFCDHCRLTWLEPDAFQLHVASHPA